MLLQGFKGWSGRKAKLLETMIMELTSIAKECGFNPVFLPTACSKSDYEYLSRNSNLRNFNLSFERKSYGILRPEGTLLHLNMLSEIKERQAVYYHGPMFRLERTQRFRDREFFQFGFEITGKLFYADFSFTLLAKIQEWLNSKGVSMKLKLNYLGERNFLNDLISTISLKSRVSENLIRKIFDKSYRKLDVWRYLSNEKRLKGLRSIGMMLRAGIELTVDPYLIRGLQYYNGIVFEFTYESITFAAGGSYDGLWGRLNPRKIGYKHFGLAIGLTRLVDLICERD